MSRCEGLSYNAWLYLMPRHVLDDLIDRKVLRPCSNHRTKLVMTRQGKDWLEGTHNITTETTKEERSNDCAATGERAATDAARG